MSLADRSHADAATAPAVAPMLVGEHGALDFLNSLFAPQGEMIDLLASGAALLAWLPAAQVLPPALAAQAATLPRAQAERLSADARALREWFRDVVRRWSQRGLAGVRADDLSHLNALMAEGLQRPRLRRDGDGLHLDAEAAGAGAAAVLAALAALCADLLVRCKPEQVRKCENPACVLWFADTKRGPRRRWCSMAACGNRHKVAAHRARARGGAPA